MSSTLRYPLERIESSDDYLSVTVLEYSPPGLPTEGFEVATSTGSLSSNKKILGTILLPMPENLTDMNGVDWNMDRLNSIAAAGVGKAIDLVSDPSINLQSALTDPGEALKTLGSKVKTGLQDFANPLFSADDNTVRDALAQYMSAQAVNVFGANIDPTGLISRTTGQVLNPNMELLFKGVMLRNFGFSFSLTPRSRAEMVQVRGIINTFKRRMAAKTTAGGSASKGIFIKAPDVFELEFKKGGRAHPFLFKMKPVALKDMKVSYTDAGSYTTYEDGTPVKMTMSLQFTELNPVYAEDYNDVAEGVGF